MNKEKLKQLIEKAFSDSEPFAPFSNVGGNFARMSILYSSPAEPYLAGLPQPLGYIPLDENSYLIRDRATPPLSRSNELAPVPEGPDLPKLNDEDESTEDKVEQCSYCKRKRPVQDFNIFAPSDYFILGRTNSWIYAKDEETETKGCLVCRHWKPKPARNDFDGPIYIDGNETDQPGVYPGMRLSKTPQEGAIYWKLCWR